MLGASIGGMELVEVTDQFNDYVFQVNPTNTPATPTESKTR